jgi:hypothetical protein
MPSRLNLIGRRYGHLVVTGLGEQRRTSGDNSVVTWVAQCDCGKTRQVDAANLRNGGTTSCGSENGCEYARKHLKTPKERTDAHLRRIWLHYFHRAKRKRITFTLTQDEIETVVFLDCWYCGAPPSNRTVFGLYSGIDRIDNNLGYVIDNVRPCCYLCNTIKGQLTFDDLKEHIVKLYLRHCT